MFLKPLRSASAKGIVKHLREDIFLVHGAPKLILCDNGKQYKSEEFKKLCSEFKITVKYNVKYNPRSNPTERTNQVIGHTLRSYVGDNQAKWDQKIPEIQHALRSSVSSVTGFSPDFLVFGADVSLDGRDHLISADVVGDLLPKVETCSRADSFLRLEKVKTEVQGRLLTAAHRNAKHYNQRRRPCTIRVGDYVWHKTYIKSDKKKGIPKELAAKKMGPYRVRKKLGAVTYDIEDADGAYVGTYTSDQLEPDKG